VNEDRVLPEVLEVYFQMPEIWSSLSGSSTGTNVRRRRLQPSEFLAISFPVPPMDVQLRLRDVHARLRLARIEQEEAAAELDALLPSALDQAFRGEW
jgi:type I restriction enzyme S subunit